MNTYIISEKIIDIVNEYPRCNLPYDGVSQEFIAEEVEKALKSFGRYILILNNNMCKRGGRIIGRTLL